MSTTEAHVEEVTRGANSRTVDMKLEVVVIPVSDVDRATKFYASLGWRQDATPPGSGVVQFTPPGSGCSVQWGAGRTTAAPGSAQGLWLIVSDLQAALDRLATAGVTPDEVFHFGAKGKESGIDPEHNTYRSFASFRDPDGNHWLFQEITNRLPGRLDPGATTFANAADLAGAMRRAEAAHGEHERRLGQRDANWSDWYAEYMVADQSGAKLPE
ncbi:MAG TPA: VOC family protein [Thermoanaerobaculia bacterium]|jgi:catechol 2,3-dioxygenase-like lactoylglutathione lyase family enzyme